MKDIDREKFEETVYDDEETAVIFFHRQGCHVCEELSGVLEELEEDFGGSAVFASVDVEAENDLFSRFGLKGVPQVILFSSGSPAKIISGLKDISVYEQELSGLVGE